MVSMVGAFKIAADMYGNEGFGEWALTRRFLSFLLPLIVCGLDIAIPRYVAMAAKSNAAGGVKAFISGALLFTAASTMIAVWLLLIFREQAAQLLFGDGAHVDFMSPICGLMVAYALYVPAYAYLRGALKIMEANLMHVLMYGVVPLVALAAFQGSLLAALQGLALLSGVVALTSLAYVIWRSGIDLGKAAAAGRVLVRYGSKRMYAAFFLLALATVPAIIAAHTSGVEQAGFVVFGMTIVGLAASAAAPLGVTMLPVAAMIMAEGGTTTLREPVRRLQWLIVASSIVGVITIWFAAPAIARVFFGDDYNEPAALLRVAALGAGPYVYFVCMRNLVDAHTERAVNTRNVFVSLVAFAIVVAVGILGAAMEAAYVSVWAYVSALAVLAVLTRRAIGNVFAARTA